MGSEKQGLTLDADAFFSNAMGLTFVASLSHFWRNCKLTAAKTRWISNYSYDAGRHILPCPALHRHLYYSV
jgi:hypothetical protein